MLGEPICVRTLSSHCKGPFRCSSIQQGVLVTVWRLKSTERGIKAVISSSISYDIIAQPNGDMALLLLLHYSRCQEKVYSVFNYYWQLYRWCKKSFKLLSVIPPPPNSFGARYLTHANHSPVGIPSQRMSEACSPPTPCPLHSSSITQTSLVDSQLQELHPPPSHSFSFTSLLPSVQNTPWFLFKPKIECNYPDCKEQVPPTYSSYAWGKQANRTLCPNCEWWTFKTNTLDRSNSTWL